VSQEYNKSHNTRRRPTAKYIPRRKMNKRPFLPLRSRQSCVEAAAAVAQSALIVAMESDELVKV
jgi:hypothetical protein